MRKAFTLIELLVVVAIIAILAAIATPNLMEAVIRSRCARVRSDMRTLAGALEAYCVDNNTYPPLWPWNPPTEDTRVRRYNHFFWEYYIGSVYYHYAPLTTPVAYVGGAVPLDAFSSRDISHYNERDSSFWYTNFMGAYQDKDSALGTSDVSSGLYYHRALQPQAEIRVNGPDGPVRQCSWIMCSASPSGILGLLLHRLGMLYPRLSDGSIVVYDPSNGTQSEGNIMRTSAGFLGE